MKLRDAKAAASAKSKARGKGKASTFINLDVSDSSEAEVDANTQAKLKAGYEAGTELEVVVLNNVLTSCRDCGSSRYCTVDKHGTHRSVSLAQRKVWIKALVSHVLFTNYQY
jgi:hypothetical protein